MTSTSKPARSSALKEASVSTSLPADLVPVVAIGASSGGVKALEAFFRNMPADCGMAFVVSMHLSHEHESRLASVLQSFTTMPVIQVDTLVEISSDHVYVVAPGQRLLLENGRFKAAPRLSISRVIDDFFHLLAEDRQEQAVGIVLSGSGSDGTRGMLAINERGGLLLAQDPEDADFPAMPCSVIDTGLVDVILPAADMPERLMMLRDTPARPHVPNAEQIPVDNVEPSPRELILANKEMRSLNEELRSMMEELEMTKEALQSLNEELVTVNQELQIKIEEHRRVNNDLHVLIESTHMPTLFLDQQLNVVLFTHESTKLFNLLPVDIGRPLEHISHRLTYAGVLEDARRVLESAVEVKREVRTKDGSWYAMRAMPYPSPDGPAEGVVLTFADITYQKKAEQVSEDRFSLAFHAGPMASAIVTHDDGYFIDVNRIFEEITGYDRKEVVGKPASEFGLFFEVDTDVSWTDARGNSVHDEVETRIRTRSGVQRDLVGSTTAIDFGGRPCYLTLFFDVTERKRLEREILLVSDREQRRIGSDLHDGLGAHLTGVSLMARGLARNLRNGRAVDPEEMDEIAQLLGEGIEQARTLAQGLNPFLLEVRGLTTALAELASNIVEQSGITCTFEEKGNEIALSNEQSMHLYRIAQEAVTNAVRHGKPDRIQITLSKKERWHRLAIQDNGVGYQSGRTSDSVPAGMGLSIMRYRAEMIGARLDVTGTPEHGTTVTCAFRNTT